MAGLKLTIQCRDCGRIRTVEFIAPILPLIDGSCCASTAEDTKKCECGCEAFYVLDDL
ncbi:MAG TPA: hypothetical protein VK436_11670 [Methanocella sp.]|nr:hypothetical protein [Methanocella sp.]